MILVLEFPFCTEKCEPYVVSQGVRKVIGTSLSTNPAIQRIGALRTEQWALAEDIILKQKSNQTRRSA